MPHIPVTDPVFEIARNTRRVELGHHRRSVTGATYLPGAARIVSSTKVSSLRFINQVVFMGAKFSLAGLLVSAPSKH